VAARDARPLTPSGRRAVVLSAIGPMSYRLRPATVAAIVADCAGLDARATVARAALWDRACRRRPLPCHYHRSRSELHLPDERVMFLPLPVVALWRQL